MRHASFNLELQSKTRTRGIYCSVMCSNVNEFNENAFVSILQNFCLSAHREHFFFFFFQIVNPPFSDSDKCCAPTTESSLSLSVPCSNASLVHSTRKKKHTHKIQIKKKTRLHGTKCETHAPFLKSYRPPHNIPTRQRFQIHTYIYRQIKGESSLFVKKKQMDKQTQHGYASGSLNHSIHL